MTGTGFSGTLSDAVRTVASGLLITEVESGGPADRAGVEPGDVLLGLGRYSVSDVDDVGELLDGTAPGDDVNISVLRVDRRGKLRLSGTLTLR